MLLPNKIWFHFRIFYFQTPPLDFYTTPGKDFSSTLFFNSFNLSGHVYHLLCVLGFPGRNFFSFLKFIFDVYVVKSLLIEKFSFCFSVSIFI